MGAPGKSVVIEGGKRGVLLGGKSAVYNAEETCPACCIEFSRRWSFTDSGFIDGGQSGAYRAYDNPEDVSASPWTVLNDGLGLRLDWEDDNNCRYHNPYTQNATATCEITVPKAMLMTVNWSGVGEVQDPGYDVMSLYVDGSLVGSAHAPGGKQGCSPMAPVVSDPPPPQQVVLNPGPHTLYITASTNDPLYHFEAWYRFDLTFALAP